MPKSDISHAPCRKSLKVTVVSGSSLCPSHRRAPADERRGLRRTLCRAYWQELTSDKLSGLLRDADRAERFYSFEFASAAWAAASRATGTRSGEQLT